MIMSNEDGESVKSAASCLSDTTKLGLEQLFVTCDTKNRGAIGPEEFRELCNKFGVNSAYSDTIFSDLDHDGDGQIDFEDFSYGFRDFLTPGSRRGSLQINSHQQLLEMEKKHASAKPAWKHFINNVGPTNIQPFMSKSCGEQLFNIVEEIRNENGIEVSRKLEKALSALIADVQGLHDEYKTLEVTFHREREAHAAQLAAMGEELDQQLAKTEAKAKAEARYEAQKQMDSERKKIAVEMESQFSDLSDKIRTFQKVEEWLTEEESRDKKLKTTEDSKLFEAENENRNLRSALVEAQMKATLLQAQLAQKRNEYIDLFQELHSEKIAATEYKNQCDLMQNHLSLLSETNRVLSDANDCFSTAVPMQSVPQIDQQAISSQSSTLQNCSTSSPDIPYTFSDTKLHSFILSDTDKDSGRGTLLEEIRAEGDGSPLPSGIWSTASASPSPESSPADTPVTMAKNMNNVSLNKSDDICKSSAYEFLSLTEPGSLNAAAKVISDPHRTFKVILAGDAAVGKTTFIERVCYGHFSPSLSSTIGVDFRVKTVDVDGNCVALQLWDTAGQERFRSLTKSYFRRADGVILMYDVTNERTFVSIRQWIQNVEEGAGRKVPIVLCGNKIDLRENYYNGSSCVSHEDGSKLGRQCGAIFAETSPKTGHNVLEALMILAREMSSVEDAELKHSLRLNEEKDLVDNAKKRSCCSGSNSSNSTNKNTSNTYTSYSS